jgi:hypothetical protein
MTPDDRPAFAVQYRALMDRICEREGILRSQIAQDLGVSYTTISGTAFKGGVSFSLIEKIAQRAQATPKELSDLEIAWLELRRARVGYSDEKFVRSVDVMSILMQTIVDIEGWIDSQGLGEDYRKWMRGRSRLLKRSKEKLK